jgi:hypothetical protein
MKCSSKGSFPKIKTVGKHFLRAVFLKMEKSGCNPKESSPLNRNRRTRPKVVYITIVNKTQKLRRET